MAGLNQVIDIAVNGAATQMNAILEARWTESVESLLATQTLTARQKRDLANRYLNGIERSITERVAALREEIEPEFDRLEERERYLNLPGLTSRDSDNGSVARCLKCGKLIS